MLRGCDRSIFGLLIGRLELDIYEDVWGLFAVILSKTNSGLDESASFQLLRHLLDVRYEAHWWAIASVLAIDSSHLDGYSVRQLAMHLINQNCEGTRWALVTIIRQCTARNMESAFVREKAKEALADCKFRAGFQLASASHNSVLFVRDVATEHGIDIGIVYDVVDRRDTALELPSRFAPPLILKSLAYVPDTADRISNKEILPILRDEIERVIGVEQAAAFAYKFFDNGAELSRYLNNKAIPKIITTLGTASTWFKIVSEGQKGLHVSKKLLMRALSVDNLVHILYELASIDVKYLPFLDAEYPDCVFVSPCCAAIHERQTLPEEWWDKADSFIFRPHACLACNKNAFNPDWQPSPQPKECLWCHSCETAYDAVLHRKLKGNRWTICPAAEKVHLNKKADRSLRETKPKRAKK